MATQTITTGMEKTKPFFEVNVTREGSQFMAVREGLEVTGFVNSKLRHVVEEIVGRVLNETKEPKPNVSAAASALVNFVVSNTHLSDYISAQLSVKAGEALMTLNVYVTYDIDKNEWRGSVDAVIECRWKKWEAKIAVKRRIVYKGININDYKLYTEIMDVASHAYAIVKEE
jgi:hypothetical protein